jgi:Flp pilus assembly protein TadB
VVDAPADRKGVVNAGSSSPAAVAAVATGVLTYGAIFTLAVLARRPPVRRPQRASGEPPTSPRISTRWWRGASIAAAALIAVVLAGPIGAAIAGLIVFVTPRVRRRRLTERARVEVRDAMPDVVEMFVVCVHAGRSPPQAIAELARTAPAAVRQAFATVELQLHRGRTLADALASLPQLIGPPGRELAGAVAAADRDGLPLAPVLDRLAAEARAERRRAGEAAARALPVRLSFPLVVCTLPSFVLLAIAPAVLGALSTLRGRAP